jgi:hypothetical protein
MFVCKSRQPKPSTTCELQNVPSNQTRGNSTGSEDSAATSIANSHTAALKNAHGYSGNI